MEKRYFYLILLFASMIFKAHFIEGNQFLNIGTKNGDESGNRKLEELPNYIVLTFNQEFSFNITGDYNEDEPVFTKNDINYIYFQNEKINKTSNDTLTVSNGTVLEIHFKRIITKCNIFVEIINEEILDKIISIDLSNFDLTQVTAMTGMFADCTELKSIKFPNVIASEVDDIDNLFENCYSLESIDLSNFKTPKLERMYSVFQNCINLKYINLSSFITSNVGGMNRLFYNCSSLESIDLSSFNTTNVVTMSNMFDNCFSLKSINLSNFDTRNVRQMSYMFKNCSSLISIDLSNFKTNVLGIIEGMFEDCTSLMFVNLSSFDTSKVQSMNILFRNCICLKVVDISNFNTSQLSDCTMVLDIFSNCEKLKYVNLYNVLDNCVISGSSLNEIDDLIVCQKNEIITNQAAKNICSGYNYDINSDTCDEILVSTEIDFQTTIYYNDEEKEISDALTQDLMTSYPNFLISSSDNSYEEDSISQSSIINAQEDESELISTNNILSFSGLVDSSNFEDLESLSSDIDSYNKEKSEIVSSSTNIPFDSTNIENLESLSSNIDSQEEIHQNTDIISSTYSSETSDIEDFESFSTNVDSKEEETQTGIEDTSSTYSKETSNTEYLESLSSNIDSKEEDQKGIEDTSSTYSIGTSTTENLVSFSESFSTDVDSEEEIQPSTDTTSSTYSSGTSKTEELENLSTNVNTKEEIQTSSDFDSSTYSKETSNTEDLENLSTNVDTKEGIQTSSDIDSSTYSKGTSNSENLENLSTNIDTKEESQKSTEDISSTSNKDLVDTTSKSSIERMSSVVNTGIETTIPNNYNGTATDKEVPTTITINPSTQKMTNVPANSDNESKKIPVYSIESINQGDCEETGILTFSGTISDAISNPIEFTLPLIYPEGVTLSCTLDGNEMECEVDRIIGGNTIIINETLIKERNEEVLLIESFFSEEQVNCANAFLMKAVNKLFVGIYFRQVSHLSKNDQENSFSFYLITLVSEAYKKGQSLNIKMDIIMNEDIVEKNATCVLEEDVSPNNGELAQGNFICSVKLSPSEYQNTAPENIKISVENDEINGVADLDDTTSSPYKTDQAIAEIRRKKANNEAINELANIFDYYEEDIKITPFFNIDSINMDNCAKQGKLILKGSFSDDIYLSIKFDLLLTYPLEEMKCEIDKPKKNEQVEVVCKVHIGFYSVETFIIEEKIIHKKNKELFIIKRKEFDFDELKDCSHYYTAKTELVRARQLSTFSFLQLSKFSPSLNSFSFFFALTRKATSISFKSIIQLTVKLIFPSRRLLRNLDTFQSGVNATCNLNKNLKTEYAAGYDCANSVTISGTPQSMELETSEINDIQGIPENLNPDDLKYKLDYSLLQNLQNIDNLPNLVINEINGDTCFTNGQYIVKATLDKNENLEDKYSNVTLRMSVPESNGLCEINIKNKSLEMVCENTEKFYMSNILIERQPIQDSEGKEIFIIDNFESTNEFACDVSINSPSTNSSNGTTDGESTDQTPNKFYFNRKNSSGLTGGAIAGIVIAIVVVLLATSVLIILGKKGVLSSKKDLDNKREYNSSNFILRAEDMMK